MTIYLDVVLIENLCMNYIILFATGYILKIEIKHIRLIISALLGGIYSVAAYLQILEIYSNILLKIILSIVMVYVAFNPQSIKQLFKQLLYNEFIRKYNNKNSSNCYYYCNSEGYVKV